MVRRRLEVPAFIVCWCLLNVLWISNDQLLRDGDEEGHVGAMELFKEMWINDGFYTWFIEMWQGSYGEYPPLFAGVMGAWWGMCAQVLGTVPPSELIVRGALLFWPLVTAAATAKIAHRLHVNWKVAGAMTLLIPLLVGVGRHFMLEPMMTAISTLSIAIAMEWKHQPSIWMATLAGLCLGLAALTKQTVIFVAPWVILSIFMSSDKRWHLLLVIVGCLPIIAPWFIQHLDLQESYLTMSAEGKMDTHIGQQLIFYPFTILYAIGLLLPLCLFCKNIQWRSLPIAIWVWIGTLGLLMMVPKQYPRLLLPWLPILPLLCAYGWKEFRNLKLQYIVSIGSLGVGLFGLQPMNPYQQQLQQIYEEFIFANTDDGCPQIWIRNPSDQDGNLSEISQTLLEGTTKTTVAIFGNPQIPCHIQTTHEWKYHLDPYFRRRDINVNIVEASDLTDQVWQDAHIQIIWKGETIETPMKLIVND